MPQIHRDNSRAEVSVVVEKADLNNLTAEHYQGINYWLSLFSRAGFGGRMFVPADERYLTWARIPFSNSGSHDEVTERSGVRESLSP
jgi:hypothetical protein